MTRIVYVNGAYKRYGEAAIHVEDRGFQFADAVYEVIEVLGGRLVDATRHLARLERSLRELAISPPMRESALLHIIGEVIRRNRVRDGIVVKTVPDNRWDRCNIKTVMLLPAVLAKDAARRAGAREAWFVDSSGAITEGASSNAWIVTAKGVLVTRPLGQEILPGVTRATVMDVAKAEGLRVEERAFTRDEALRATEAFITSATNIAMPVVTIDGQGIGNGLPGPLTRRLRSRFHQMAEISAV